MTEQSNRPDFPTPHEDAIRPGHETIKSRLIKAQDELATAQQAEADARAKVEAHEALAVTKATKPKDWSHDLGELQGAVTWAVNRAGNKKAELAEAERQMQEADRALALAQIEDRADVIGAFDQDEFIARWNTKLQPIKDELWSEVHQLGDLEQEIAEIAGAAGIDQGEDRYTPPTTASGRKLEHRFDGVALHVLPYAGVAVDRVFTAGDDPRSAAIAAQYQAERQARQDAEDAERQAEYAARREAEELRWKRHAMGTLEPQPLQYGGGSGRPMRAFTA